LNAAGRVCSLPVPLQSSVISSTRTSLGFVLNANGAFSGSFKMQWQDVVLVPHCAFQRPAAVMIRKLRNVEVVA